MSHVSTTVSSYTTMKYSAQSTLLKFHITWHLVSAGCYGAANWSLV